MPSAQTPSTSADKFLLVFFGVMIQRHIVGDYGQLAACSMTVHINYSLHTKKVTIEPKHKQQQNAKKHCTACTTYLQHNNSPISPTVLVSSVALFCQLMISYGKPLSSSYFLATRCRTFTHTGITKYR